MHRRNLPECVATQCPGVCTPHLSGGSAQPSSHPGARHTTLSDASTVHCSREQPAPYHALDHIDVETLFLLTLFPARSLPAPILQNEIECYESSQQVFRLALSVLVTHAHLLSFELLFQVTGNGSQTCANRVTAAGAKARDDTLQSVAAELGRQEAAGQSLAYVGGAAC